MGPAGLLKRRLRRIGQDEPTSRTAHDTTVDNAGLAPHRIDDRSYPPDLGHDTVWLCQRRFATNKPTVRTVAGPG
jgi:hypothetical protein